MRRPFFFRVSVLLAFAVSGSRLARADTETEKVPALSADAETHIARGLELRRQRRDADALVEFRAAYGIQKSSRTLAQIALAEDAVGLWIEAEEAFDDVLAGTGDPWVDKRRDALSEELRTLRAHLADLEIESTPASAEIWIDGVVAHRRAATGTFRVVSGRVLVEAKAPGFEPARRVIEVPPGARLGEAIALIETAPPSPVKIESTSPSVTAVPATNRPVEATHSGERMTIPRIVALSSFGLAGVAAVVGTVGAIERSVALNEYNDNAFCNYDGVPRSVRCAGVASDFNHFSTVMTAGYVTAGVAAVAGGVLAFAFPGHARIDVAPQGQRGFLIGAEGEF